MNNIDCAENPRACPVNSKAFIDRMARIESEIEENRRSRHERNAQINSVIDSMRLEQMAADKRIGLLETILQRITQLLEGYLQHQGLVGTVSEHGRRLDQNDKKMNIAIGGIAVLQILIGLGVFAPLFSR